ncbi:MAG: nicotinate (nicotinamide) nucleotide adenylyltransferase, partial [Chloroflexi bacterium]|nr:nicotinate (nicotinamide) nucleotide adenylyltransferase [Chloroflexota bacterium]
MRVGVLGGSFDPVHVGHLGLAETAYEQADLDRVIFVPAGNQWRKAGQRMAPAGERCEMVRLAIAGRPHFELATLEVEREGPSYSDVTLEALREERPGAEIVFILGRDALADLPNWHAPERVLELATLAVAGRAGGGGTTASEALPGGLRGRVIWLDMPPVNVSATDIRERVRAGRSIEGLVPEAVGEYIAGENVTVDIYRSLPDRGYDLVILRVHAGITTEVNAATGERTGTEYV